MFARKKQGTSATSAWPAQTNKAPAQLSPRSEAFGARATSPKFLLDTPHAWRRAWPRGKPDEFGRVLGDLALAVGHLAWWVIAGLARLVFALLRLVALGLGALARAISGQRLRERASEVIGWVVVALALLGALTSVGFARGWLPPKGLGVRHGAIAPPYVAPATPPPCVARRAACVGPAETMDGLSSISAATILSVLQHNQSPAASADFADALYDLGYQYGVNPAYALGFFDEESHFGTSGIAATTHSIGNVRYSQSSSPISYSNYQGFRQYASWRDGAEDWYWTIRTYYVNQGIRDIYDVTPIYAPVTDNNNPQQYAQTVLQLVQGWAS